jgi:hypothetical protein
MTTIRLGVWLRRLVDLLASGRLTVVLLLAASVLLYLYLTVPQEGMAGERVLAAWLEQSGALGRWSHALGLTDLLHSRLFWILYGLLMLNLSVCLTRRVPVVARLCWLPDRPPQPGLDWTWRSVSAPDAGPDEVATLLRKRGYRTRVDGVVLYGLRGRFACVGHWVFHAGLLALLIAGGWLGAAPAPFRGTVGVGEDEPFDLRTARLVTANRALDEALPPLRFHLDRVELVLEDGEPRRLAVSVTTSQGDREELGANRPLRSPPYQVLLHGFGYMPGWVVENARGRPVNGAWVKLVPYPLEEEDWFSLGPPESGVHVRFYPDHTLENGEDRTRSQALRNPRFRATVSWRGADVYEGLLEPGQRVALDGDRVFHFLPEVRRYGLLDVIEERGQAPIFACLGVVIAGLLVRYARIRKEVVVRVGENALELHGRGEIFEHLFTEELDRLAADLANAGAAPADGAETT